MSRLQEVVPEKHDSQKKAATDGVSMDLNIGETNQALALCDETGQIYHDLRLKQPKFWNFGFEACGPCECDFWDFLGWFLISHLESRNNHFFCWLFQLGWVMVPKSLPWKNAWKSPFPSIKDWLLRVPGTYPTPCECVFCWLFLYTYPTYVFPPNVLKRRNHRLSADWGLDISKNSLVGYIVFVCVCVPFY